MRPVLISCYFGEGDRGQWPRMARVLAHTAERHLEGWDVRITPITPEPLTSALGNLGHVQNTQKMEFWFSAAMALPDGAEVLLIDADTMIVRPLDDVWMMPFDFAYTTKASRYPFNSGVVFLRLSPRVRAFLETWRAENRRMLGDAVHHQGWRLKYGGINQAALGFALDTRLTDGLAMLQLPCVEWNCEDSSWAYFDPTRTRIVHVKSGLRRTIFSLTPSPARQVRRLAQVWRKLEAQTKAVEETQARA